VKTGSGIHLQDIGDSSSEINGWTRVAGWATVDTECECTTRRGNHIRVELGVALLGESEAKRGDDQEQRFEHGGLSVLVHMHYK